MYRVGVATTWTVCALAAIGTALLGSASGLFWPGPVGPSGVAATLAPYLALAVLAWGCRRHPVLLGIMFAVALVVGGYGLLFFFNDWYWPQPTNPNPWRVWMVPVVIVPQLAVVGVMAVTLLAHRLWSTRRT